MSSEITLPYRTHVLFPLPHPAERIPAFFLGRQLALDFAPSLSWTAAVLAPRIRE